MTPPGLTAPGKGRAPERSRYRTAEAREAQGPSGAALTALYSYCRLRAVTSAMAPPGWKPHRRRAPDQAAERNFRGKRK